MSHVLSVSVPNELYNELQAQRAGTSMSSACRVLIERALASTESDPAPLGTHLCEDLAVAYKDLITNASAQAHLRYNEAFQRVLLHGRGKI